MLARAPWARMSRAGRTGAAAASTWKVTLPAPASTYASAWRSASVIIRGGWMGRGVACGGRAGIGDDQVGVDGSGGGVAGRLDHRGAERQVGDEVVVHHVHVDPVAARDPGQ